MYHPPARPGTDRSESYAEWPERRGFWGSGPGAASLVREDGGSDCIFGEYTAPFADKSAPTDSKFQL
ncbi:Unknown protein sequence [Pseudomonas syringae pv. maculicola]|nr:Unknown protein sequence [Pseudomonas syringae pv. maculicola]